MRKSRKRPQKRSHIKHQLGSSPAARRPRIADLIIAADDLVSGREFATAEDWQRLEESFLAEHPVCPDCGAIWDLELAGQEVYPLDGEISLIVPCQRSEAAEIEGREPPRHVSSNGLIRHTLPVADLAR